MNNNTLFAIISLAFSVTAVLLGLICIKRLGGKLKTAVMFLIFAVGLVIIREILSLFNLLQNLFVGFAIRLLITAFILMAVLNINQMIKIIDGEYKKVLSKEQSGKKKGC